MTRFTRLTVTLVVVLIVGAAPLPAYAASATFFGPIVPPECNCEAVDGIQTAPSYGCVLATIQNLINFGITLGVVAATIALVYAGFIWMLNGSNPEARRKGSTMLLNVFVGLLILLSAWLVVDFVMKQLYVGEDKSAEFGPWNSILASEGNDTCIVPKKPTKIPGILGGAFTTVVGGGGAQISGGPSAAGGGANCPAADPGRMVAFPAEATAGETEKATQATVSNFLAMRQAALRDKIDLKVTDGYRSEAEQVSLWKSRGSKAVAQPCTLGGGGSNHNSGEAIDINVGCSNGQTNCNTKAYQWLKSNGAQWNFRNALPSDPVHWSPSGR